MSFMLAQFVVNFKPLINLPSNKYFEAHTFVFSSFTTQESINLNWINFIAWEIRALLVLCSVIGSDLGELRTALCEGYAVQGALLYNTCVMTSGWLQDTVRLKSIPLCNTEESCNDKVYFSTPLPYRKETATDSIEITKKKKKALYCVRTVEAELLQNGQGLCSLVLSMTSSTLWEGFTAQTVNSTWWEWSWNDGTPSKKIRPSTQ